LKREKISYANRDLMDLPIITHSCGIRAHQTGRDCEWQAPCCKANFPRLFPDIFINPRLFPDHFFDSLTFPGFPVEVANLMNASQCIVCQPRSTVLYGAHCLLPFWQMLLISKSQLKSTNLYGHFSGQVNNEDTIQQAVCMRQKLRGSNERKLRLIDETAFFKKHLATQFTLQLPKRVNGFKLGTKNSLRQINQ
jgi:hypothetical protein